MVTGRHGVGHKACADRRGGGSPPDGSIMAPHLLRAGILAFFGMPPLIWNQASASPMRRTELLTKSRPHVATRDIAEGTVRGM
jgi:hypothetical protein